MLTMLDRQNPVSIPLEVITIIADFLAGSNSFGTLFNLSLANKQVRQECVPIFYETMIIPDTNLWALRMKKAIIGGDNLPKEWQWCRSGHLPNMPTSCTDTVP
jgi:hypothetical protein